MKFNAIMLTIVALAMALLVGCTQEQVLTSLEASVAATETLVAALEVTGRISPGIADEIENAIADLPAAFRETAAELSSSDSAAARAAKIAGYYSATVVALKALPQTLADYRRSLVAPPPPPGPPAGPGAVLMTRLKTELDLTPEQTEQLKTVLDDFFTYYYTLQAQLDDVRASGKQRILRILDDGQKKKFDKIMAEQDKRLR